MGFETYKVLTPSFKSEERVDKCSAISFITEVVRENYGGVLQEVSSRIRKGTSWVKSGRVLETGNGLYVFFFVVFSSLMLCLFWRMFWSGDECEGGDRSLFLFGFFHWVLGASGGYFLNFTSLNAAHDLTLGIYDESWDSKVIFGPLLGAFLASLFKFPYDLKRTE